MANTNYKYTKLSDLKEGDRDINIYGIVKYYREPIKTSIGQYNSICTIFDESIADNLEKALRCNLFGDSIDKLPQVENVGDIIRFHRVFIKYFNGRLQLQANKKSSSWIVFQKNDITKPLSSHPNYTQTSTDKARVKELKDLFDKLGGVDESSTEMTLLKDFQCNTFINCVVQVIGIYKFEADPNHCVLNVSDGTKVSFSSFRQTHQLDQDSPMTWCDKDLVNSTKNYSYDISLFDEHVTILDSLKVGDLIVISNLHVKAVVDTDFSKSLKDTLNLEEVEGSKGWAELIVHSGRSFNRGVYITDENKNKKVSEIKSRIQGLKAEYEKSKTVPTNTAARSLQDSLTTTNYPSQPFVPIAIVLKQTVPNKHRIRGKLLALKPTNTKDFVIKLCNDCNEIFPQNFCDYCPNCPDSELVTQYFFEMLIEDDTGLIEVEAFGNEAEYFLNNISPETLLSDNALMENVRIKFEKVLDAKNDPKNLESVRHLPWIELCVMSFIGGANNTSITYRIFGTSLI